MAEAVLLPTGLDDLRGALNALIAEERWAGETDEVLVAVQEAVINAARHGHGVREVVAHVTRGELVVEVADHGEGFDPGGYLANPPDLFAEAGRGLWLMGQMASRVELRDDAEGARLQLRFGPGGAEATPAEVSWEVPSLDSLGMGMLDMVGGAAMLIDPGLVVREAAGAIGPLLEMDAGALTGHDIRGVVAELKHRFADPASYESAMLDLLAQPEHNAESMFLLASGQFVRQQAVALREGDELVGRVLLFMPAASHTEAQADFQRALLPSVPAMEGLTIGATYHAAEDTWLVGGDFYDFFDLPSGCGVVVGDVSGRGPYAAAAGVTTRAYVRSTLSIAGLSGAVRAVNRALIDELDDEQYVTMAMVIRESQDVWTLTLCGHPPPLLYRDGQVTSFEPRDMLLGMHHEGEWGRQLFHLRRGDVLLLYTDGITEAGPPSDQFGVQRLAEALKELAHHPPQQLVEAIDARVHSFTSDHISDDRVLVAVSRQ